MNILYIAYSCNPYEGSEDKIGWNVPAESAKTNAVWVITKEEQRGAVEKYLRENPQRNLKFVFVDIPDVCKKVFRGFLYSGRLSIWNHRAVDVAKKVCEENAIQIVHQITPIEFRAIGDYYKIPGVRFVCGPLGGGESIPDGLRNYVKGHWPVELLRSCVNSWSRLLLKATGKLKKCHYVMFANFETWKYLDNSRRPAFADCVFFDNGLCEEELAEYKRPVSQKKNCITFLVAGRLIYRKGHSFLLDALKRLPESLEYTCRIVGGGPALDTLRTKCAATPKLKEHVVFTGAIPYSEMEKEYAKADVFIMPSIRETTGTVLLEAMAKGIPVITIGKFGGAVLFDGESSWLYSGQSKDSYIEGLKNAIQECIERPDEVQRRGKNAQKHAEKYTWKSKNQHYQEIYHMILAQKVL